MVFEEEENSGKQDATGLMREGCAEEGDQEEKDARDKRRRKRRMWSLRMVVYGRRDKKQRIKGNLEQC